MSDLINYKEDWAGECRVDPVDGNGYVLRAIEPMVPSLPERGFFVVVNDVLGGHTRRIDADEWVRWTK